MTHLRHRSRTLAVMRQCPDRNPFPAAAAPGLSSPGNDNLEVFSGNDHGLVTRGVEASDESDDVACERFAAGLLKRLKCLEHRSIVDPEDIEEVLRRAVAEGEVARLSCYGGRRCAERRLHPLLRTPDRRRLNAGRRREVLSDRLEHLSDETLGGPVGEADSSTGPAH